VAQELSAEVPPPQDRGLPKRSKRDSGKVAGAWTDLPHRVGVVRSSRRAPVVLQQPAEPFLALDGA
jgi:hypothetical protein